MEALDELASIALRGKPNHQEIAAKIREITMQGMDGKIPFTESLQKRILLLNANKVHLEELVALLKKSISSSFMRNREFFKKYGANIYVISGGFKEFILPVVKELHIPEQNVHANTFRFDAQGNIIGYDDANPLAKENGKGMLLSSLKLQGEVYVVGDGYTDYKMKDIGQATKFFAFTENIARQSTVEKADHVVQSFDEFLYMNKLPMSLSYPKSMMKVLLLDNVHPDAVNAFRSEGFQVEAVAGLKEDELCERIKGVSILGIRTKTEVSEKVLQNADRLLAIGAFSVGTNNITLKACTKKGVVIFNAPFSNTRSVVELAMGNILMLMRGVMDKSMKLHQGIWDKSAKGSHEIRGKKLGIVGYGNIGSQLSVLAEAVGMEVYYYDIVEKLAMGNVRKCASMEELLRKVDVVTLHIDGNSKRTVIGQREIEMMKDGALLLNLSRGFLVDIPALANAIRQGKLGGAALDVFPNEPKSNNEKFVSELQGLPNVILTPHVGGSTEEAQQDIGRFVSANIRNFVNTGSTTASVNFPQLQLSEVKGAHRFIHLHRNVPGILAQINSALALHSINILGQYLRTNEDIGYVITDVDATYEKNVVDALKTIPDTIRFRVLY